MDESALKKTSQADLPKSKKSILDITPKNVYFHTPIFIKKCQKDTKSERIWSFLWQQQAILELAW